MTPLPLLLIEDEPSIRLAIRRYMEGSGFAVEEAATCESGRAAAARSRFAAAILDYRLPDGTGLELISELRRFDASMPIILLSAFATIEVAVSAVKDGASHVLVKPVELATLVHVIRREIENARARRVNAAQRALGKRGSVNPFGGESPAIRELEETAKRFAETGRPILISGETGTGKGVLAEWLHAQSARRDESMVDINCASLSRELLESELFGHGRGAFTGASAAKPGLFEVADRGTLFLDEIGDLDLAVQPRLLKTIESGRFRRLGDVEDRESDVRLIAASHVNLESAVQEKRFRSDLYFRISTLPLRVPALRERLLDVPILARGLLAQIAAELGRSSLELSPDAEQALQQYPWPGNVRELKNRLERAAILAQGTRLTSAEVLPSPGERPTGGNEVTTLRELERLHIQRALEGTQGDVSAAALRLGISRSSLYMRLQRHGLRLPRSRGTA